MCQDCLKCQLRLRWRPEYRPEYGPENSPNDSLGIISESYIRIGAYLRMSAFLPSGIISSAFSFSPSSPTPSSPATLQVRNPYASSSSFLHIIIFSPIVRYLQPPVSKSPIEHQVSLLPRTTHGRTFANHDASRRRA